MILRLTPPTPAIACSSPAVVNGIPRQRFRKELIRVGDFVDTKNGRPFTVTRGTLLNWVGGFSRMKAAGVKVNVPETHAAAADPAKNRGWVDELIVEGDSLFGILELIGADAIQAAARNDVSIYSPPEFVDGRGERYAWPITHVALCPDPLIPGLGEFIPLAASRAAGIAPMSALVADAEERAERANVSRGKADAVAASRDETPPSCPLLADAARRASMAPKTWTDTGGM